MADADAAGEATAKGIANQAFSFCLGAQDFMLVLPARSSGTHRIIGLIPQEFSGREDVTFENIRPIAEKTADIHVNTVNWFSTYRVHHRVAEHFRVGRMFILGDAGHIHSPLGGQGMNTRIGDAINLAWKLAAVIQGCADAFLLDTYEPERITFARSLVATTDKLFQLVKGSGLGHRLVRKALFHHFIPSLLGFRVTRKAVFRKISQTRLSYHASALSGGATGQVDGGDRLPWAQHQFDWADHLGRTGFERDALYLIRPDGYVALVEGSQDVTDLQAYLSKFKISSRLAAGVETGSMPGVSKTRI